MTDDSTECPIEQDVVARATDRSTPDAGTYNSEKAASETSGGAVAPKSADAIAAAYGRSRSVDRVGDSRGALDLPLHYRVRSMARALKHSSH